MEDQPRIIKFIRILIIATVILVVLGGLVMTYQLIKYRNQPPAENTNTTLE